MLIENWILEFTLSATIIFCDNLKQLCRRDATKSLQFLLNNIINESFNNFEQTIHVNIIQNNDTFNLNNTFINYKTNDSNNNSTLINIINITNISYNVTTSNNEIAEQFTTTERIKNDLDYDAYYWESGESGYESSDYEEDINVTDTDDEEQEPTTPGNPLLEGMGFTTYGEEAFMWCADRSVYASRYTGLPPSRENYWNGTLDVKTLQKQNLTINDQIIFILELTNPANVTSNPSNWSPDSTVEKINDKTYILRTDTVPKNLEFVVKASPGLPFPRLASASLNEIPICRELLKYGPSLIGPQPQAIASPLLPPFTFVPNCGRKMTDYTALVTKGELTKLGDWPWHVAIFLYSPDFRKKDYICGGSIISRTSIITAAHCMVTHQGQRIPAARFTVILGKYNLYEKDASEVEMKVSAIMIHSGFSTETFKDDIALMNTSHSIAFGYYIQPICLWNSNQITKEVIYGETGTLVGWGTNENATLSDKLMLAKMKTVSDSRCLVSKPDFFKRFINNSSFCAGNGPTSGQSVSACKGDSGGGLHYPIKEVDDHITWYLRGVVSIGVEQPITGLCDTRHFVVFTDVAQYLDWIEENGGVIKYTWFYNSTSDSDSKSKQ